MPARPKTSDSEIIAATRELLERKGRDGFSMNDIAAAVGIRAPSLYRRFEHRAALLGEVELVLWDALGQALANVVADEPAETLIRQAHAYRRFAKRNPNGYSLMFDATSPHTEAGVQARARALTAAMPAFTALVGVDHALAAARVITPYLHGFISMELAGAFRLGGGLDAAFNEGVTSILRGLEAMPATASASRNPTRRRRV